MNQNTSNWKRFYALVPIFFLFLFAIWDVVDPSEAKSRYSGKLPLLYFPWVIIQVVAFVAILLGISNKKRYSLLLGIVLQVVNLFLVGTLLKPTAQYSNSGLISSSIFLLIWVGILAINWKRYT